MSLFFRNLIDELISLEEGVKFKLYDANDTSIFTRIFLLGAYCDKPTQALLQYLPEPIAAFGCGRCEVEGLLTRITKGTRRHAQEIINNFHIIQEAYCHLNDLALTHNDFGEYLSSRFTNNKVSNLSQDCRLGHASKKEDSLVQLLFPLTKVKCYQTIHLDKVCLYTRTYAEGRVADDSYIIFVLDRVQRPGKIRAIFTIDDDEPHLLMAHITVLSPFTCQIDENENFVYHNILSSTNSTWQYVPIRLEALVEKSIFFRGVGGVSYFLRQPTLDHCS
ncbi:unnamed protein product [Adineta steineri]|uniref:Uncharacterized protein n=2 Tax=Adineta steineri TaxID=433720 RepID=A0A815I960_9BILA|nr:unnamed protein product [Adineta steineri]